MKLSEMEGITPELLVVLEAVGIDSIDALADVPYADLITVPGLDEDLAETLQSTAQVTSDELKKLIEKTIAEELAKEAAAERPLFDESALDVGAIDSDEALAAFEQGEVPMPKDDLFKDFPTGSEGEAGAEEEEKKVDPFANTELDD